MGAAMAVRGGGRYRLGQNAEINVTPFVDVMLVLLIIFMVAAPLPTVSIRADIPPPSKVVVPPARKPVIINVQKGGRVLIGDHATTLASLPVDVKAALGATGQGDRIMIRSDRDVAYRDFMAVLNRLENQGLPKVALVSEDL